MTDQLAMFSDPAVAVNRELADQSIRAAHIKGAWVFKAADGSTRAWKPEVGSWVTFYCPYANDIEAGEPRFVHGANGFVLEHDPDSGIYIVEYWMTGKWGKTSPTNGMKFMLMPEDVWMHMPLERGDVSLEDLEKTKVKP